MHFISAQNALQDKLGHITITPSESGGNLYLLLRTRLAAHNLLTFLYTRLHTPFLPAFISSFDSVGGFRFTS